MKTNCNEDFDALFLRRYESPIKFEGLYKLTMQKVSDLYELSTSVSTGPTLDLFMR